MKNEEKIIELLTEIRDLQKTHLNRFDENLKKQSEQYDNYLMKHKKQVFRLLAIAFILILAFTFINGLFLFGA